MLSVICPIYNEEKYIAKCIESILAQDYPKEDLEVIFVDGMSVDKTREIVNEYISKYSFIKSKIINGTTISNSILKFKYANNIKFVDEKGKEYTPYERINKYKKDNLFFDFVDIAKMSINCLKENPIELDYIPLFTVEWGENGEVETITANYKESMYVINEIFPSNKLIFLMCGGGGYAWMTKQILIKLGYDETKDELLWQGEFSCSRVKCCKKLILCKNTCIC